MSKTCDICKGHGLLGLPPQSCHYCGGKGFTETNKDCLGCDNSMSIPGEESESGEDELFCLIKKEIVKENECCEEYY